MKVFLEKNPYLITTGGGEPGLPDDTVENFSRALKLGSQAIRTNVSVTRDGKLVLFSDAIFGIPSLSRRDLSTLDHGAIRDLYLEFINNPGAVEESRRSCREPFPLLEQALESFPACLYNFNLQGSAPGLAGEFCRTIERSGAGDRVLVSSYGGSMIKKIRSLMPGTATSFSFIDLAGFYALHRSGLIFLRKKFIADALIMPEAMGVSFFASPALVEEARARNLRAYVLGVNSADAARRVRHARVDGVITGNIALIINATS